MNTHAFKMRIYYEDTDFSGVVYHARYLHFLERARTEFLRERGIDQRVLFEAEGGPCFFAVTHMDIAFKRPARMDDMIEVETAIKDFGAASFVLSQVLKRGEELLVTAEVTVAFLAGGKPKRMPGEMRARMRG